MSHWDNLQNASHLASVANAEISERLQANGLQASLIEQNNLRGLKESQLRAQQKNDVQMEAMYQQRIDQEMSQLRQAVSQQQSHNYSNLGNNITSSQGTGLTMAQMEKAVRRIIDEERPKNKPKKKQDVSGLKRLLKKT